MSDKITLHGHEIDLPRGTKVFAGQIPAPHDGFGLIFTDAAGAKTHLCLSREAFDAVAMLHAWLVDIPVAHHKLICDIQGAIDPGSQWVQTNPLEVIPSAVETAAEPCVFYAHDEPRVYLICADDESEALARLREVAPGADDDDIKRFGRGKAVIVFNEPEPPSAFVSQDRFENDDGSRSPGTPNFLEDAYHRALDKLVMSRTFMTLEAQQAFDEEWGRSMRSAVKTSTESTNEKGRPE